MTVRLETDPSVSSHSRTDNDELPDEINEEEWPQYTKSTGLLFPNGTIKFRWDLFMLFLILYSCISVPFRLGMNHPAEEWWWSVEVFVSLCFLTDLCLVFNTSYLDGDQLVLNRTMIRNYYLRGWFIVDALSSLPLELIEVVTHMIKQAEGIEEDTDEEGALRLIRALRLVRLMRLLRLLKIQSYVNAVEEALNINLQMLQLAKVICGIVYLCHILGCLFFFLADNHTELEPTWLSEYDGGSGVDANVWKQYLFSVYWALTTLTTVGYGDIVPVNDTERSYALVSMITGALVFGYLLSTVSELLRNADPNRVQIQRRLDQVKHYLRWHKFTPELAARVKRYYEFYFSQRSGMDEDDIIKCLAPTLQRDVQAHLLSRTVQKVPLFAEDRDYVTLDLQLLVHSLLKPLLREAKETVVSNLEKGHEAGPSIFFLRRGALAAMSDMPDVIFFEVDAGREPGSFIGEHTLMRRSGKAVLTNRTTPRASRQHKKPLSVFTYRARTRCELFALGVADLAKITAHILKDGKEMDEMAETIYNTHSKRMMTRGLVMRLSLNHAIQTGCKDQTFIAALRLQTCWAQGKSREIVRNHVGVDALPYQDLLPGLFKANFAEEEARGSSMPPVRGSGWSVSSLLDIAQGQASFRQSADNGQPAERKRSVVKLTSPQEGEGDSFRKNRAEADTRKAMSRFEQMQALLETQMQSQLDLQSQLQSQMQALLEAEASREERTCKAVRAAVEQEFRKAQADAAFSSDSFTSSFVAREPHGDQHQYVADPKYGA